MQGHLNITDTNIPNCVYIKATSDIGDMVRYQSYKFTVCVIRIVHTFSSKRFDYFYYEWFVPVEMQDGVAWDIYFYVSKF